MVETAKVQASLGKEDHDWMLHPDYILDGVVSIASIPLKFPLEEFLSNNECIVIGKEWNGMHLV